MKGIKQLERRWARIDAIDAALRSNEEALHALAVRWASRGLLEIRVYDQARHTATRCVWGVGGTVSPPHLLEQVRALGQQRSRLLHQLEEVRAAL